jgi:TonB family protein
MNHLHLFGVAVVCITWGTVAAQTGPPRLTPSEAPAHAGETATVCGEVVATSCRQAGGGRDLFLLLTVPPNPSPVRIRIPADQREVFGIGLDERLRNRQVCATGTITRVGPGYQLTATEPSAFQDPPSRDVFAPDTHSGCDVGVEVPTLVSRGDPAYTAEAMRRRVEGGVLMLAVVQIDGTVGEVRVLSPLDPGLDERAMEALRTWRFQPGTYRGQPVPVIVSVEMTFTIHKPDR